MNYEVIINIVDFWYLLADIRYGNSYRHKEERSGQGDESQTANYSREGLAQLLKLVESRLQTR